MTKKRRWAEEMDLDELKESGDLELEVSDPELDKDIEHSNESVIDTEADNDDEFSETAESLDSGDPPQSNLDFPSNNPSITNPVKPFGEVGLLSIIYSKNGTRLSLSKDLNEELNEPTTVQFGLIGSEFIVGEALGEEFTDYSLKKQGAK